MTWLVCALLACSADPVVLEAAPAEPAVPEAAAPTEGVEVFGLELGVDRHAQVLAWLEAHSLDACTATPSAARTSFRYECDGELPAELLDGADLALGRLSRLLLVRPDEGPVHHLSTVRKHPTPQSATADYLASRERIQAALGEPRRTQEPPPPERMAGPIVRVATTWTSPSLEVILSILKVGDGPMTLQEQWTVPTPEAQAERAEGRAPNPHILRP